MFLRFTNKSSGTFRPYIVLGCLSLVILFLGSKGGKIGTLEGPDPYLDLYQKRLDSLGYKLKEAISQVSKTRILAETHKVEMLKTIHEMRLCLKKQDFWLRYFDPVQYRKINGSMQIEWETEAHEKWEKPYKRVGSGLALSEEYLYVAGNECTSDSLSEFFKQALIGVQAFQQDSHLLQLRSPSNFFFANRLFLLNLAAIYSTGFECPDTSRILPELKALLSGTRNIYKAFELQFPQYKLPDSYLSLYDELEHYVASASPYWSDFNHFEFIKDYVNPLYAQNSRLINVHQFYSSSVVDFSINNDAKSLFGKNLYRAQDVAGVFRRVHSDSMKTEIRKFGKLLFYDPILSGNNERSCASCHIPQNYFSDTSVRTPLAFDRIHRLQRNAPTLLNVRNNHLIMLDGKHLSLSEQLKAVHANPEEMSGDPVSTLKKIRSCEAYKSKLDDLAKWSSEKDVGFEHVVSAITFYYSSFDTARSALDEAMENKRTLDAGQIAGFNLFMGRAQCGTCHFPPHFNGVKPPYTNSEFEVLGVPQDDSFTKMSEDSGRYRVLQVPEMFHAFRTGSLRNISRTKPYMHNGVFQDLNQLIEFYNRGGGAGRGFRIPNQSLSKDSLALSELDKMHLLRFLESLDENILLEDKPEGLPRSRNRALNKRSVGGVY